MAEKKLVTYYDNLKVARNSPLEVIRAAYRALCQKYHPDKYSDRRRAEHIIKILNRAYEVLSDPLRRQKHDEWIAEQEALKVAEERQYAAKEQRAAADASQVRERASDAEEAKHQTQKGASGATGYMGPRFDDAARFRNEPTFDIGTSSARAHSTRVMGSWLMTLPFYLIAKLLKQLRRFIGWSIGKMAFVGLVLLVVGGALGLIVKMGEWMTSQSSLAIVKNPVPNVTAQTKHDPTIPTAPQLSLEVASRCFWVYAPIAEVGRDFPHNELFHFGQERMVWYDQFIKTNKGNLDWKRIFENGIARYKPSAYHLQDSLQEAISTNNQNLFTSVIAAAIACDKDLNIRTDFVPRMK